MTVEIQKLELSGWGRYPRELADTIRPLTVEQARPPLEGPMISRGQGRSYGDAAMLSHGLVMLTENLSRFLSFDEKSGLLRTEAGTTLDEILQRFVPQGWFPSVVPGTKSVSLGGAVAADIHGKNHHRDGPFGDSVIDFDIVLADGTQRTCSRENDSDLFWATVGGMGLTGIVTNVTLKLARIETPYVIAQHHQARNLDQSLEMLDSPVWDDHYTVAWLDCLAKGASLGRSILMRGHHARLEELPKQLRERLPPRRRSQHDLRFDFPSWFLNPFAVRAFNEVYYRWQGFRQSPFVCDYESFFFPLDRIGNWNRMYGKRGFVQYQCVLPLAESRRGLRLLLGETVKSGGASFLAVLKRFGPEGKGFLSFPHEGYTLTLDFALGDPRLFPFLERLDQIVVKHGGRIYLAKDARLQAGVFREMYPRLENWLRIKAEVDPRNRFDSDLARRLGLKPRVE